MLRVQAGVAVLGAGIFVMMGGCSGTSVPVWLQTKQSLRFESEPSGAEVRTADGQVCRTPCSLSLPLNAQSANFTLQGYSPQTVPVHVHQSTERLSDNSFPPPDFEPNPVEVTLQAIETPAAKGNAPKRNNGVVQRPQKKIPPAGITSVAPMTAPSTIPTLVVPMAPPGSSR